MLTGEKLRLLRIVKGWKQQFVADKLGISQQAYSKLEKRDFIKKDVLTRIMQSTNCTEEDMEAIDKIIQSMQKNRMPEMNAGMNKPTC